MVTDMLQASIFIEADCETCLERRHKRGRGSRKKGVNTSADWFRELVWGHYEMYKDTQLKNVPDALRLDGTKERDDLHWESSQYCWKLLKNAGQQESNEKSQTWKKA